LKRYKSQRQTRKKMNFEDENGQGG